MDEDVLEEFIEESISGSVLLVPSFSSPRFGRGQCSRIVCLRSIVKTCNAVIYSLSKMHFDSRDVDWKYLEKDIFVTGRFHSLLLLFVFAFLLLVLLFSLFVIV